MNCRLITLARVYVTFFFAKVSFRQGWNSHSGVTTEDTVCESLCWCQPVQPFLLWLKVLKAAYTCHNCFKAISACYMIFLITFDPCICCKQWAKYAVLIVEIQVLASLRSYVRTKSCRLFDWACHWLAFSCFWVLHCPLPLAHSSSVLHPVRIFIVVQSSQF